jgi:hypothetical protein
VKEMYLEELMDVIVILKLSVAVLKTALSFAQPRIAQPRLSCSFLLLAYDILRQPSLLLAYRIVHPSLASGVG